MSDDKLNIADALFPEAKQRVLAVLFNQPDKNFHTNEIIRLTNMGRGVVQRELEKLSTSGIITLVQIGNQKRYQANRSSPLFGEISVLF